MTLRAMLLIAAAAATGCHGPAPTAPPGNALAKAGDPRPVEATAHPDNVGRRAKLARFAREADYDELFAELERWTTAEPGRPDAWLALSQWLMDPDVPDHLGDRAAALVAASRALQAGAAPDPTLLVTLGTARYLSDDVDGARQAYQAALTANGQLDCRAELEAWVRSLR